MIVDLLVVLVAAKLAAEACERLRLPAVLGEIVAGVAIGPSALGLVHTSEPLEFLAELGVIVLLLQVGLDTDIAELRAVGRASLLVAIVGVALPLVGGTAGMLALGHDTSVALFVGAALTATSVGITARVFGDLRALATVEARTVLGAAVADDVLGLVLLTAVVRLSTSGDLGALDVATVVVVAAGFVVVGGALALRAAPPVLAAVGRRSRSSGSMLIAAVAIALGLAALADGAGLAPIVGAFLAGMAIGAGQGNGTERVRRDLTPIAHVLVPVFFVGIGLEADLGAFARPEVLGVAALLVAVATLGKLGAAVGAAGLPGDKVLIGLGMLPRGEVGLIFAGIGLREGVLPDGLYASVLVVVLVTTLATPPLLRVRIDQQRRRRRTVEPATGMPEGGWLATTDGVVSLRGTPPPELALVLAFEAAVLVANARPSPRLLQWFVGLQGETGEWDAAARAQFVALLRNGNARSWRFLDAVGLLESAVPELATSLERRRADASELDPVRVFQWATVEGVKALASTDELRHLAHPDRLLLAALVLDVAEHPSDAVLAASQLAKRLALGTDAEDEVALLAGEHGLLRAAAVRPDGLDEHRVLQLAEYLVTAERARAAYLLEVAGEDLERWQRERLDELHAEVQQVLRGSDATGNGVAEQRRLEAALLDPRPSTRARLHAAPRHWLVAQPPAALARAAALLDPLPRTGRFRVLVSGSRLDIAARDRRGLLATVTAVLASSGVVIRQASTATWPDGAVAMSFVAAAAAGDVDAAVLQQRLDAGGSSFAVAAVPDAHAAFDHHASPWFTILDVVAADRPGLLASLAAACSAAGASIHSALVRTSADGVAHDRFELTDGRGAKLDAAACAMVRAALSGNVKGPRKPAIVPKQTSDRLETTHP